MTRGGRDVSLFSLLKLEGASASRHERDAAAGNSLSRVMRSSLQLIIPEAVFGGRPLSFPLFFFLLFSRLVLRVSFHRGERGRKMIPRTIPARSTTLQISLAGEPALIYPARFRYRTDACKSASSSFDRGY